MKCSIYNFNYVTLCTFFNSIHNRQDPLLNDCQRKLHILHTQPSGFLVALLNMLFPVLLILLYFLLARFRQSVIFLYSVRCMDHRFYEFTKTLVLFL